MDCSQIKISIMMFKAVKTAQVYEKDTLQRKETRQEEARNNQKIKANMTNQKYTLPMRLSF
jgi:hypothetical protein